MFLHTLTDRRLQACAWLTIALLASGCATSKDEMLPHGDATMMDVWDQGTTGSAGSASSRLLLDARQTLRRPLDPQQTAMRNDNAAFTRTAVCCGSRGRRRVCLASS